MPRIRKGIIYSVSLAIGLLGVFPRVVYAQASCSVISSGSLVPNSSGTVTLQVNNAGDTPLQWVYMYKSDSANPFTDGSANGWSVASSDESRMEFTGGAIEPGSTTSYTLVITTGADIGNIGFDVQASETSDGSDRIECGSTSVDIVEVPSSTPTPTSVNSSTTTTVTTVITATPQPTTRPTPTSVPDRTGPIIRVTTDITKPFTAPPAIQGTIMDGSGIGSVSYSVDGGKNFSPVDSVTGAAVKKFSFTPHVSLDDNYMIAVRGVDGVGNITLQPVGALVIDRMPPKIGAVLISLGSIVIDEKNGVVPLIAGVPYRMTLSAVGGPVTIRVKITGQSDEIVLSKNRDTGLWEGTVALRSPGDARMAVTARDGAENTVTYDVATIHGVISGGISDDHGRISDVHVRVFVKNSKGVFVRWNGAEYGQDAQMKTDSEGRYAGMLPPGTYYVEYEKDGYRAVRTRIFTFEKASVVSANVTMYPRRGFWVWGHTWFIPLFDTTTQTIDIRPIAELSDGNSVSSVHVGETLPYVPFIYNENPVSYLSFRGKPTLVTFLTLWSPTAIRQLHVINRLAANTNVHVLGVFSQQTDSSIDVIAKRGLYKVALVADPDGTASEAVSLHHVPMHVIMDRAGIVRHVYTGFMDESALQDALVK